MASISANLPTNLSSRHRRLFAFSTPWKRSTQTDRRAKQIHTTEAGKVIAAEIDALATRVRAEIMEGISDEDAAVTLKVIRAMAANLQQVVKG